MDTIAKIITALGLADDATDAQVLERIADLRREVSGDDEASLIDQIEAGTHEQVAANADGTMTVTLFYPIKIGKTEITEIKLCRPKAKHMRATDAKDGAVAKQLALIAALAGLSTKELDELDFDDFQVVRAVTNFFSVKRRRTGAVS
jgi:hypothetical protein